MSSIRSKMWITNRDGFTFLTAIFMVMIIGIMLAMTGQSWKMIMQREREKELLFRGSQIKEAIENWYNPQYTTNGVRRHSTIALTDLKYLLDDPTTTSHLRYLPHSYAAELNEKDDKCRPDCPKIKLFQDPLTGKEWDIIKCDPSSAGHEICTKYPGTNVIIGVASRSKEKPIRTNFKDTALEKMGLGSALIPALGTVETIKPVAPFAGAGESNQSQPPSPGAAATGKIEKYSEWKFVADSTNDHSKLYKAYREGW